MYFLVWFTNSGPITLFYSRPPLYRYNIWRSKPAKAPYLQSSFSSRRLLTIQLPQTDLGDAAAKQRLADWLPKVVMKRMRKQHGRYLSMSTYHYQRRGNLLPTNYRIEHQYNSGRIAFRFGESLVVQSLNQGYLTHPKVYMDVNRFPIRPGGWLLSDEFLIAQELGR